MTGDQREWDKIESIIDDALKLERGQRTDFIRKQCEGDERLFRKILDYLDAIQDSEGYLEEPAHSLLDELFDAGRPPKNSLIDQTIGSYKITELIDHGGMGSVYRAKRIGKNFDQEVAIKVIRRGMDTPENFARFNREKQILANLNHPNIAELYDGGITEDGLPYLVMEYVEGRPVDTYCDDHHLSIDERMDLFKQICQGIQHAHKNLVIHRDLKPSNIFVTEERHIKILDFGISKILESNDPSIYETSEQLYPVSPGYAAPEQLLKEPVTTEVDTYGLGVVLYQMLAGGTSIRPRRKKYSSNRTNYP